MDRADEYISCQSCRQECLVSAASCRFVDVVDDVYFSPRPLEQILHCLLRLGLVALSERAANDCGRVQWEPHPLKEAVVAGYPDTGARVEVHRQDARRGTAQPGLDVVP